MTLIPTATVVADARATGAAAVALNVIGLEHVEAVIAGAERAGCDVILAVSANAVRFRGTLEPLAAAARIAAEAAGTRVALHLDHAKALELCRLAAANGFSSVMFDAAAATDEENIRATAGAAAWAREAGVWLEGELGEIAGRDGDLTDPAGAVDYVAATGVDGLAVAVGSEHKLAEPTATLDLERVRALRAAVPVPLVLHGSSGVSDAGLQAAVAAGITKVNIGTRLAGAYLRETRAVLAAEPPVADPRDLLRPVRAAMADATEALLRALSAPSPG